VTEIEFVSWKNHGKWSKWHIKSPRRDGRTLCGLAYDGVLNIVKVDDYGIWICGCRNCDDKDRAGLVAKESE